MQWKTIFSSARQLRFPSRWLVSVENPAINLIRRNHRKKYEDTKVLMQSRKDFLGISFTFRNHFALFVHILDALVSGPEDESVGEQEEKESTRTVGKEVLADEGSQRGSERRSVKIRKTSDRQRGRNPRRDG